MALRVEPTLYEPHDPLPNTSAVLGRLQDFLPKMQAANEQLERRLQSGAARAADVDIEAVDARAGGPVIKMDLACGLFDVKDARALEAAERALEAGPLAQPGSDGEDDSSDDDDSSSSGGDDDGEGPSGGAAAGQEDEEMADGGGGVAAGGAGRGGASGQRQQRRRLKGKAKRPLIQEVGAQEQQQQQQQPTSRQ